MKKLLFFLLLIISISCSKKIQPKKDFIIISKDDNKEVSNWLKHNNLNYDLKIAYNLNKDSLNYYINNAVGIIISGGNDVNPLLYTNDSSQLLRCGKIDYYRDSLEQSLINKGFKNKIPLLGICRGSQIMNVTFGGSLIVDIPSDIDSPLLHRANKDSLVHQIYFNKQSKRIIKIDSVWTNSRHHQAVDKIAKNFSVLAQTNDGVIEGIYYNKSDHPFIMGVQFHPEDIYNSVSDSIAEKFKTEIVNFQQI